MRKVIFKIDDNEYLRKEFKKEECTETQIEDILEGLRSFKAIYTLYGVGNNVDRYELTDNDGNKISINTLNGYEKGVILNDCYAYFVGGKYYSDAKEPFGKPFGVVKIIEEEV